LPKNISPSVHHIKLIAINAANVMFFPPQKIKLPH